jgi:hypothetical protein
MAFKCTYCKIWSVRLPIQTTIKGMCDECYKEHLKALSSCQTDLALTEQQRIDLENEVRKNLNRE